GAWTFGVQTRITGDAVLDSGTQGQPSLVYATPVYQRINGVDVANVQAGRYGDGITATNYQAISAPVDLRVQYRWTNNVTLFGAIDNVQNLPTDTTLRRAYRMGVRFSY